MGSFSPYDTNLKKEMPFRPQPGAFMDGFDDLRVTHPVSPVASACKSYDSCDTLTTAMSSTRHEEDDDLSCNTIILNSYEDDDDDVDDDDSICIDGMDDIDDELSLFSRTACLPRDKFLYDDDRRETIGIAPERDASAEMNTVSKPPPPRCSSLDLSGANVRTYSALAA